MNLHDIAPESEYSWVWLRADGANGRNLGTHLWRIEHSTPQPFNHRTTYGGTVDTWSTYTWQTPARFDWHPLAAGFSDLTGRPWINPICNHTSRSRSPRMRFWVRDYEMCQNCRQAALHRGIIPITYESIDNQRLRNIRAEAAQWVQAGRPDVWNYDSIPEAGNPTEWIYNRTTT